MLWFAMLPGTVVWRGVCQCNNGMLTCARTDGMGKRNIISNVLIYKKEFGDAKMVEKPFKNIEVGYSAIVKTEMITASYEMLFFITVNFGPSSIEILEPQTIKLDLWQAQGVLNSVSDMMHQFAARGAGGIILQKIK